MKLKNKPNLVYQPREDSYFLMNYVEDRAPGKKVLDMGTGTGIQAIKAYKVGAKEVKAVDINKRAVELSKENFEINDCKIEVKKSNLFQSTKEEFDLIIFNPPYLPTDDSLENEKIRKSIFGGETGKELIFDFLSEAKNHLKEKGKILLLISSKTGEKEISRKAKEKGFQVNLLGVKKLAFERLFVFELS